MEVAGSRHVWVNHRDPGRSLVVATLKDFGLGVYDLAGRHLQSVPPQPTPPGAAAHSARSPR